MFIKLAYYFFFSANRTHFDKTFISTHIFLLPFLRFGWWAFERTAQDSPWRRSPPPGSAPSRLFDSAWSRPVAFGPADCMRLPQVGRFRTAHGSLAGPSPFRLYPLSLAPGSRYRPAASGLSLPSRPCGLSPPLSPRLRFSAGPGDALYRATRCGVIFFIQHWLHIRNFCIDYMVTLL